MVKIRPKSVIQFEVKGRCPTHARTDARVGKHTVIVDEPKARGGTDQGPTPTQMMVISLASCINVITNRVAEEMGIPIKGFSVNVTAHFDRRGVTGEKEIDVPFPRIDATIKFKTTASKNKVGRLKTGLRQRCPISKVLRAAGTNLRETWDVEYA